MVILIPRIFARRIERDGKSRIVRQIFFINAAAKICKIVAFEKSGVGRCRAFDVAKNCILKNESSF